MCCHATDVRLERALVESSVYMGNGGLDVVCCISWSRVAACGIEHLDGEWLVLMWCVATDVRLKWALLESCVWMGTGWF